MPLVGRVAIHGMHEFAQIVAAQDGVNFLGPLHGVGDGPAGQHARMHHQEGLAGMFVGAHQGLLAHPVEQGITVGSVENGAQCVTARRFAGAVGRGKQVQIVVAQ